jgi:hypothetical protein
VARQTISDPAERDPELGVGNFAGLGERRRPGVLVLFFDSEGSLISVMALDVAEGQIQGVSSIVNPDKLRHLGPLADLGVLLRERS